MEIQTLKNITVADWSQTFNRAFADYLFPFALSEADFEAKMKAENIIPEYSVGAFDEGQLVGFVCIGIDNFQNETVAYNAGTGVIPEYRGARLTRKMYDFLLPYLAEKQIVSHLLEVLTANEKAIPIYHKIGFEIHRKLNCFKGYIAKSELAYDIRPIDFPANAADFWDHQPAYQNSSACIQRASNQHVILGAFAKDDLAGYLVLQPSNARIKQYGVARDWRRKGIGRALFDHAQQIAKDKMISLINVDNRDLETMAFLQKIGLDMTVQQYEMSKKYMQK